MIRSKHLKPLAHVVLQVMLVEAGCVTIAMYCLIQFYIQLKGDLTKHSPFLKILAIKLVIFLSFWQNVSLSSVPALHKAYTVISP